MTAVHFIDLPPDSFLVRRSAWFLPFAMVVVVLLGFSSFELRQRSQSLKGAIEVNQDVVNGIGDLLTIVDDAETGQRGFLLTGQKAFLEPFQNGADNAARALAALRLTTLSEPEQHARVEAIASLVGDKFANLELTIQLFKSAKGEAALNMVKSGVGKAMMDKIRAHCRELRSSESIALKENLKKAQRDGWISFVVTTGASLCLFLLLAVCRAVIKSTNRERNATLKELGEQQFYASSLLGSGIGPILVMNPGGVITDANGQMELLTGWTHDEMVGTLFRNYSTDPDLAEACIAKALNGIRVTDCELAVRARDGSETRVAYDAISFYDRNQKLQGIFATARDVSERMQIAQMHRDANIALGSAMAATATELAELGRSNKALQTSEATVRSLLDNASDGILTVDMSGTMLTVNRMAETLFGYMGSELVGKSVDILLPENVRHRHASHRAAFGQHPHGRPMGLGMDLSGRRKDGSEFPVEISLSYVSADRSSEGVAMAFVSDISVRAKSNLERHNMIAKLEGALAEKTVLLQEIHHRVKNNLAVVCGLLGMQASAIGDERLTTAFEECRQRVSSMALVHEYLYATEHLDRVNFGQYIHQLTSELAAVNSIAPDLVSVEIEAEEIDLPVSLAVPCGLILNELLCNSFKHAFPNGRSGKLTVNFSRLRNGELSLLCRDDGIGIPADLDWQKGGSLGLEIMRILTKQIDGTMSLDEANRDVGTAFEVRFPGVEPTSQAAHA